MFKLGASVCVRSLAPICVKSHLVKAIKPEILISLKVQHVRNSSFFNRLTQEELWKGTTSVSNAGRRKGRGKGSDRKQRKDLNKGKRIGAGRVSVQWPGLSTGVFTDGGLSKIKVLPEAKKETEIKSVVRKRKRTVHPLDRGWTGFSVKGQRIGPPDPIQDETFKNFQSVILKYKLRLKQTGTLGKKRIFSAIVFTGNGDGVFGCGTAKAIEGRAAINLAKNRAIKKLLTLNLIEKHTVNHDFFSQYGKTKVIAFKRPRGHGLVCHRIIKSICQLMGIEDLAVTVEGPINVIHIIRAFVVGLLRQKTYQEIADEKKLHLVEFKEESFNFPVVLASPKECLKESEMPSGPVIFEEYIMGDRLIKERSNAVPFFQRLPSWQTHLKKTCYRRNHEKVVIDLRVKYDSVRSHLTDIFPECRSTGYGKKQKES